MSIFALLSFEIERHDLLKVIDLQVRCFVLTVSPIRLVQNCSLIIAIPNMKCIPDMKDIQFL